MTSTSRRRGGAPALTPRSATQDAMALLSRLPRIGGPVRVVSRASAGGTLTVISPAGPGADLGGIEAAARRMPDVTRCVSGPAGVGIYRACPARKAA